MTKLAVKIVWRIKIPIFNFANSGEINNLKNDFNSGSVSLCQCRVVGGGVIVKSNTIAMKPNKAARKKRPLSEIEGTKVGPRNIAIANEIPIIIPTIAIEKVR